MDTRIDERDLRLLEGDPYTFAVLRRILRTPCELVLTDHEKLILCHSESRYPVWLWTPDGLSDGDKARAWAVAQEHRPLSAGYRYNMKYELAEDFIARGEANGISVGIVARLFAYDCPAPVAPARPTDGRACLCGPEDLDTVATLLRGFYWEIGERNIDAEYCRARATDAVARQGLFLWKDASGRIASICGLRRADDLGSLGPVYTSPAFRRRHYAQHLVYHVTRLAAAEGLRPMLYTDAEYPASNACYRGVGYALRGRLCTLAADRRGE